MANKFITFLVTLSFPLLFVVFGGGGDAIVVLSTVPPCFDYTYFLPRTFTHFIYILERELLT